MYALIDLADSMGDLGLSGSQLAARADLRQVIDDLTALATKAELVAEPPATYMPEMAAGGIPIGSGWRGPVASRVVYESLPRPRS